MVYPSARIQYMKKISIIVPCFNEAGVIEKYYSAMTDMWERSGLSASYIPEFIFVNDGSDDGTGELIQALSDRDKNVRYTSFSRNFGKEAAIFCGLKQAEGDAVIVMDADLQHPPAAIPEMIHIWEEGYTIIEGKKRYRGREKRSMGIMARIFYALMSRITGFDMSDSSDFKLIDRIAVDTLNSLSERATFFRALTYWIGYRSATFTYDVAERAGGKSKWTGRSLSWYALVNLTSFTYAPLYLIGITGLIILLIGAGLGIDAVISYIGGKSVGGYPSLVLLITLATGGIMFNLGIIAVYIAKMYTELKNRPRYIIDRQK